MGYLCNKDENITIVLWTSVQYSLLPVSQSLCDRGEKRRCTGTDTCAGVINLQQMLSMSFPGLLFIENY